MANYFYNKHLLPEIPADILAEYPYAIISKITSEANGMSMYYLDVSKTKWYYNETTNPVTLRFSEAAEYRAYTIVSNTWTLKGSYNDTGGMPVGSYNNVYWDYVWSNYDVPKGSVDSADVYLATSEPVLYEGEGLTYTIRENTLAAIADAIRAKTGKTDAMSAYNMATEIKAIEVGSSGSGASVQADWDQNDETAADYIKNRPFYKDVMTIFEEDVRSISDAEPYIFPFSLFTTGEENFKITFDDETYDLGTTLLPDYNGYYVGNRFVYIQFMLNITGVTLEELLSYTPELSIWNHDTGEPFLIIGGKNEEGGWDDSVMMMPDTETHHLIIEGVGIHKLDSSFIDWAGGNAPSSLPEVTAEDDDKVLIVENGKWTMGSIADGDEVYY
jgi:hypothetical protein